jgi:hypothetical protein
LRSFQFSEKTVGKKWEQILEINGNKYWKKMGIVFLTGLGYACRRLEGVLVVPIGCLRD